MNVDRIAPKYSSSSYFGPTCVQSTPTVDGGIASKQYFTDVAVPTCTTGSFTAQITCGGSGLYSVPCSYVLQGNNVELTIPTFSVTGHGFAMQITNLPAVLRPSKTVMTPISGEGGHVWDLQNATGTGFSSVCASPGRNLYCAVSTAPANNVAMISSDGYTWTSYSSTGANNWHSVCGEHPTLLCAVGDGAVMISGNGTSWTAQTGGVIANQWTSVVYSSSLHLFCAVSDNGTGNGVMTSPEGEHWTTRASAADLQWSSVCWSPSLPMFCAVAKDSVSSSSVMTSANGIAWVLQTSSTVAAWEGVCWSSSLNLFCAVGSNYVMTSPNGVDWTARIISTDEYIWTSVAWSRIYQCFYAVTRTFADKGMSAYSADGTTWYLRAVPILDDWVGVCAGNTESHVFISVSNHGRIITTPRVSTPVTVYALSITSGGTTYILNSEGGYTFDEQAIYTFYPNTISYTKSAIIV